MGRVGNASPHHQEIHHNAAFDTFDNTPPPPPPEEDLYEPPADYQPTNSKDKSTPPPPPPPQVVHPFPPPQGNDYDKAEAPHPFPPPQPDIKPTTPQSFQQQTPQQFPPNFVPPQNNVMGFAQQNQPWNSHLFDCMKNPQNAIITLFFPCVTFGQIAEILDNGNTSCGTSGLVYSLIACCLGMPCLMSCGYRSKLRAKFGLVESPAPDCLIHCFCEYCALCQEYRELQDRGFDPSIGHAGNVAKQQMQMQQKFGMASPMQQRMI